MRVYYDHDGVRITETTVQVPGRRFTLGELGELGTARGGADPTARRLLGSAGALAVLAAVAAFTARPLITVIATGLAVGVALGAAAVAQFQGRRYQLWCRYRGAPVVLYETPDVDELGKITRALRRALAADRERNWPASHAA